MPKTIKKPIPDQDRLFIGTFPGGLSYADRGREQDGDYLRLAFLPYKELQLRWEIGQPDRHVPKAIVHAITADAQHMASLRGQPFRTSSAGQTITLGK